MITPPLVASGTAGSVVTMSTPARRTPTAAAAAAASASSPGEIPSRIVSLSAGAFWFVTRFTGTTRPG
jgi:hypothetical protein